MSSSTGGDGTGDDTSCDESIGQFLSITGSADPSCASSYLEMSGGDLSMAVGLYLEHHPSDSGGIGGVGIDRNGNDNEGIGGDSGGGSRGRRTRGISGTADTTAIFDEDGIRAPDATRSMRLVDFDEPSSANRGNGDVMMDGSVIPGIMMSAAAASLGGNGRDGGNPFAFPLAVPSAREMANLAAANPNVGDWGYDDDGKDDSDHMESDDAFSPSSSSLRTRSHNAPSNGNTEMETATDGGRLSDMFAQPLNLMHTAGGFQGARNDARDARRWLLVNLQSDNDFACHALNRDVWRDELVENLVREGFIFWQSMNTSPDGETYVRRYNVLAFPHVAILDPRTGRLMWKREGWNQCDPMTPASFAERAADFCSGHSFDRPPVAPSSSLTSTTPLSSSSPASALGSVPASVAPVSGSTSSKRKSDVTDMTEDEQLQAALRASMAEEVGSGSGSDSDSIEVWKGTNNINVINEHSETRDTGESTEMVSAVVGIQSEPFPTSAGLPSFEQEILTMDVAQSPTSGDDDVAKVMIRMPDGKRLVRSFRGVETVKTIYAFVAQSNDDAKNGKEFELKVGHPPKDLLCSAENSIRFTGLAGGNITVRWKE